MARRNDLAPRVMRQKDFDFSEKKSRYESSDFSFLRPLKPTIVFSTYWRFAAERQKIFFRRIRQSPPPWTEDDIFLKHKFTNTYRASDRVSQYLIRNVIYRGDQSEREIFFRTLLFKFFNRIETWELLCKHFGAVTSVDFVAQKYDKVLTNEMEKGSRLYSAAYIMPSGGPNSGFERKHRMHLALIERMLSDDLPFKLGEATSMASAFSMLRNYPTIGDFLAFQYVIDLNYSTLLNFGEMDFVVAGPGAKDGIRKCFSDTGGLTESEVIKFITDRQSECFKAIGISFQDLWGRPLQLIDCQNLFCEVDKYSRLAHPEFCGISGRSRIKQIFRTSGNLLEPWYPPKWQINERIRKGVPNV